MQPGAVVDAYSGRFGRDTSEVRADLEAYSALLTRWNGTHNLVSRETLSELWPRHIADSLQLLPLIRESDRHLIDLGSGGGFPAIPLAIGLKARHATVTMVESAGKKASFLRTVARELKLDAVVLNDRIESARIEPADVITARALAPLGVLLALALPFFGHTTRALFLKGREHVEEVDDSADSWIYDVVTHPSRTQADAAILEISNLRRRTKDLAQ